MGVFYITLKFFTQDDFGSFWVFWTKVWGCFLWLIAIILRTKITNWSVQKALCMAWVWDCFGPSLLNLYFIQFWVWQYKQKHLVSTWQTTTFDRKYSHPIPSLYCEVRIQHTLLVKLILLHDMVKQEFRHCFWGWIYYLLFDIGLFLSLIFPFSIGAHYFNSSIVSCFNVYLVIWVC